MQLYLGFYLKNSACFGYSPCPSSGVTYVMPTDAYAVMILLMMGLVNAQTRRVLDRVHEIKAKIQLHLVGYIYTY
jgi:hypothetical protein